MDTYQKAELTASIRHLAIYLKSQILIYNPKSGLQLAEKQKKKKNTRNCKALCVSPKRNEWRKKDLWLQKEEAKY